MKSIELGVKKESNYYIYSPSLQGQKTFFYPLVVGNFMYEENYSIKRQTYNSFLIMHIKNGSLSVEIDGAAFYANKDEIVLLDCFKPHKYTAIKESEVTWLHFGSVVAREYFNTITENQKYKFNDTLNIIKTLNKIYRIFSENLPIKEALISKYITDILTDLILNSENTSSINNIEKSIIYINENISKEITLETLARNVALSPFYFTRIF
ncbi:MAG: AraC family ligand binding domain-containing protein [Lachnospirales bacterium]